MTDREDVLRSIAYTRGERRTLRGRVVQWQESGSMSIKFAIVIIGTVLFLTHAHAQSIEWNEKK